MTFSSKYIYVKSTLILRIINTFTFIFSFIVLPIDYWLPVTFSAVSGYWLIVIYLRSSPYLKNTNRYYTIISPKGKKTA